MNQIGQEMDTVPESVISAATRRSNACRLDRYRLSEIFFSLGFSPFARKVTRAERRY